MPVCGSGPTGSAWLILFKATKAALRSVALRATSLREEIRILEHQLAELVAVIAPATIGTFAMGVDTASALLIAVGENPDRLRSEGGLCTPLRCGTHPGIFGQDR
jgi:hypothetical protein